MAPPKLPSKKSQRNGTTPHRTEPRPDHPLARCTPRGDRVVIRRDQRKTSTEGGILLPDTMHQSRKQHGTVWSVGPGNRNKDGELVPVELKKGQRVLITGYAGLEISDPANVNTQDEEFVILRDEDVIAILDDYD